MGGFYYQKEIERDVALFKLDDKSLIYYHDKLHILWSKLEDGYSFDWTFLDVFKLHHEIIKEMSDRDMKHYAPINSLDTVQYFSDISKPVIYSVEMKYNGFHTTIHKKGNDVKIFSEQKKDLTKAFPNVVKEVLKISNKDFVIDGEIIPFDSKGNVLGRNELMKYTGAVESGKQPDDSNIKVFVWDITYLDKPIDKLILLKRLELLKELKFNNTIKDGERKIVSNPNELKDAIEWASKLKGSEGAVVKNMYAPYEFGDSSTWLKFRHLTELNVIVLKKVPKERGLYNYLVGIESNKDFINKKYIEFSGVERYVVLGHTFNTKEVFKEGDKIKILIEEAWRHESPEGIHYSIHKARVDGKSNKIDNVDTMEDIVTSIGVAIKHSYIEDNDIIELAEKYFLNSNGEGKEIQVKNFPNLMQEDFKKQIGKWSPYVMQVHTIGDRLHYDIRHDVGNHLQGITLFGRSIQDRLPIENQQNNIRSTIKLPQPKEWLTFEGITNKGGVGATKSNPGIFTIISKGKYTIDEVTPHVIRIEYKSDDNNINKITMHKAETEGYKIPEDLPGKMINLTGKFSWHIAHIGDNYIILFDRLKNLN